MRYLILPTVVACWWALAFAASAQPSEMPVGSNPVRSTESIIVTAPRPVPEAILQDFIKSSAAPSPLIGKIARWKDGVCPGTTGLSEEANTFLTHRIKEVAGIIGAPVARDNPCKINVDIVFTSDPQRLLDNVRRNYPDLLGYHETAQQAQRIAIVSHVVQAWYATQTEDLNGMKNIDSAQKNRGVDLFVPPSLLCRTGCQVFVPDAREERIDGSRIGDRLRSELYHVIVTVDLRKISGYQVGPLADYITTLIFSPAQSFEPCQELLSITNLMSPSCDNSRKANAITPYDIAYLRAIYRMDLSGSLQEQRSAIGYQMEKDLGKR